MDYSNRLSDRIVQALDLAVEQEDKDVTVLLSQALELSVTRGAGGADFKERRSLDDDVKDLLQRASKL